MELTEVTSSTIAAVGYDKATETLTIRFKHGGTYSYPGVPEVEHQELMKAESIGKHFHMHIRSKYAANRVIEEPGKRFITKFGCLSSFRKPSEEADAN